MQHKTGTIGWLDLTVEDAGAVRDFYAAVVGWTPAPVPMGEYDDFSMSPPGSEPVAGICHKRGGNAILPPMWIPYFIVDDLDESMAACRSNGGELITGPKEYGGYGRWCVVRDPAGAAAAIFEEQLPEGA